MTTSRSSMRLAPEKERGPVLALAFSLLFTLLFALAFLVVATLIAYNTEDPGALLAPLSYAAVGCSSLFAGVSSAKLRGKQGLFMGALAGLLFIAILFLCSFLPGMTRHTNLWGVLPMYAVILALSLIGGRIGGIKREKKRKR